MTLSEAQSGEEPSHTAALVCTGHLSKLFKPFFTKRQLWLSKLGDITSLQSLAGPPVYIVTSDDTPADLISLGRPQYLLVGWMAAVASFEAGVHSNAGTALSEAEAAFSGVDDVPADDSQAQSYGGNSPVCQARQVSAQ